MTDISKIQNLRQCSEDGAWCRLKLPHTGEDTDIEVLMQGPDAPRVAPVLSKIMNMSLLNRLGPGVQAEVTATAEATNICSQRPDTVMELVKIAFLDVRGLEKEGEEVTKEGFLEVLADHKEWMLDQLFLFMVMRGNFYRSDGES